MFWSTFSGCVIYLDIAWSCPTVEQEKGLREKLRTFFEAQVRLIFHKVNNEFQCILVNIPLAKNIRHLIVSSHVLKKKVIQIERNDGWNVVN